MKNKLAIFLTLGLSTALLSLLAHKIPTQATSSTKKVTLKVAAGTVRTPAEMTASNAEKSKHVGKEILFRPTIGSAKYAQLKAAANARKSNGKPGASSSTPVAPLVPTITKTCSGASNVSGLTPPDTHGAVGTTQFVEVTNSRITVYNKSGCPAPSLNVSLNSFFGYATQTAFDPRVIFDAPSKRWIVISDAFPESTTVQRLLIAVSTTANAAGSYCNYQVDVDFFNNNDFFDYPQLGQDRSNAIITANIFPAAGGFSGADEFAIPKSVLYSCAGFSVPLHTGLAATLAPPIVLDQNPLSYLAAANTSGNVAIYALNRATLALTGPTNIPVPAYSIPPSAHQSGTTVTLDTLDARFQNASTQKGSSLWNVHTVALGAFPAPYFYQINTSANSITQQGFFFASSTSDDFNPSVAANTLGDAFFTFSSTDAPASINAQVRASSCSHLALCPTGSAGGGLALVTSPTFLSDSGSPNRWGDYSAVSIYPLNSTKAWVVNEKAVNSSTWGSQYGVISGF